LLPRVQDWIRLLLASPRPPIFGGKWMTMEAPISHLISL
jgi:hypothetical protein